MTKRTKVDHMKLSQDATNEIWSVILRAKHRTPGEKKRAIEREIRATLEHALGLPCTVSGTETGFNGLGEPCAKIAPNPYSNAGVAR